MEIHFDYCNKEEWLAYINDTITPIMRVTSYLLSFNYFLNDYYTGIAISEVLKNDALKEKLLGGLSENGESSNRSLAEFYKSFFGWTLADLRKYLLHQSENINIVILTTKNETDFIHFLQKVQSYCQDIFNSAFEIGLIAKPQFNFETNGEDLFKSDEALIKEISLLYELLARFVINYNEKTLFIWTLRKNTKRYLLFQYEKLREPDCFEFIETLMGLNTFYKIDLYEEELSETFEELQDKYTIWELRDQFGYNIIGLNNLIFDSFEGDLKEYFDFVIKNPEDFKKSYQEKIERVKPIWEIPKEFKLHKPHETGKGSWDLTYKINGAFFTECRRISTWARIGTEFVPCNLSFLDFLDSISPALFVGAIELRINNNWCEYITKLY